MGNKISPLIIRENRGFNDWYINQTETASFFLLKNYLFNFFLKKGLLINNFLIKKTNTILYINMDFFISKTSTLYTKKFRKNIKKKKKKKIFFIYNFLKTISKLYKVKKIYIKINRIDIILPYRLLKIMLAKGNKIRLKKNIMKNILLKDFLIVSLFLIAKTEVKININLLLLILAKYFTWLPKRQQKRFLIFIRDYFKLLYKLDQNLNNKIAGFKFIISGKIAGKSKANFFRSSVGNLFTQTVSKKVNFSKTVSYTKLGTYGWKLWVTEK